MPEKPIVPPTRKPVSEFPTPDPSVAFYTELVNRDDPAYYANAPMKRGMLYSTIVGAKREVIATYPQLFFLRERKFSQNDQLVLWDWATDEQAHDTYNAEVTYIANSVTYPAFTRTYTVRRELYESDPTSVIGSPLPGIISVEITSPGQNHTQARGVINGTSVAVQFTVSPEGGLLSGIITNTGEELIQDGTAITIIGDGQDSSAIAHSQPVGCVLTAQKKEELPDNDPLSHELVKVTRVYETLPSPWIYTTRPDKDGMFVTSKTRRQVTDFITDKDEIIPNGDNSLWVQTWHKGTDDFVSEETVEERPVPGNPIISTKVEEDGMILTSIKTLIDVSAAVNSETLLTGVWTKNYIQEVDDGTIIKVHDASNKVAWQMSDARAIPGNLMETTRIDNDGVVIHVGTTLSEASTIIDGETLVGGVWTKVTQDAVSDLVGKKIVETRTIPGNTVPSSRVDEDGIPVYILTTYKDKTTITTGETLIGGTWTKTKEDHCTSDMGVSDLVADEVIESRAIPGNPMVDIKIDKDGFPRDVIKTLKDTTLIVQGEFLGGGVTWYTVEKEAVSELVAREIVTAREVPGNDIPSSGIASDLNVENIHTTLRDTTSITPSSSEAGGFITTVEKKEVTDLISDEVRTVRKWTDTAAYSISVINLIPREFMAEIPTKVVSHIIPGVASQPAIGFQEFEHSQNQLNKLFYEERITTIDAPSLPITHSNPETTEIYGGGVINLTYTLAILGSIGIDQGLLVVSSSLTDLGNGMVVKETRALPNPPNTAWPPLQGTDLDEVHLVALPYVKQTVDAGTTGGIAGNVYTQVRPIDVWRSDSVATTVPTDLSSLNRDYATVVNHAFPDTLIDATLDFVAVSTNGFTIYDFGLSYTLLRGYRGACDGHIYEVYTYGPPSGLPTVTKFFPQSAMRTVTAYSFCTDSVEACSGRAFARVWEFEFPMSLHDAITVTNTGYSMTIPATIPIALPASGTEITVDIQTERWKYGIYITKIINVIMP